MAKAKKEVTGWAIEGENARKRIGVYKSPADAVEAAKKLYQTGVEQHAKFCVLMREKRFHEGVVAGLDKELQAMAQEGYDLMPSIRVVEDTGTANNYTIGGKKKVIWEDGEAK